MGTDAKTEVERVRRKLKPLIEDFSDYLDRLIRDFRQGKVETLGKQYLTSPDISTPTFGGGAIDAVPRAICAECKSYEDGECTLTEGGFGGERPSDTPACAEFRRRGVEIEKEEEIFKFVVRRGGKWCVAHSSNHKPGATIKCFDRKEEALAMHSAIMMHKQEQVEKTYNIDPRFKPRGSAAALRDDYRILAAHYSQLCQGQTVTAHRDRKGEVKLEGESGKRAIVQLAAKVAEVLIERDAIQFHPPYKNKHSQEYFERVSRRLRSKGVKLPISKEFDVQIPDPSQPIGISEGLASCFAEDQFEKQAGRSRFDVKVGDKGRFVVQSHIRGLDEDEVDKLRGIRTYDQWVSTLKGFKGANDHNDWRIAIDGKDYWIGFQSSHPGKIGSENPILDPGDKKMQAFGFKPHGKDFAWMNRVGVRKPYIAEPGEEGEPYEPGATPHTYGALFRIDRGKIEITKAGPHAIEFILSGTKLIPSGIWQLNAIPRGRGEERFWLLSCIGKQS